MKHKRSHCALRSALAAVLAAVLAGCGAKPPPPESTAGGKQPAAPTVTPGRSHLPESTPPDSMHATTFITEQYALEKVVQAENGAIVRLNIHIPRLESDSADAACERGLLPPGEVKAGNTAWWATLDELPFSLDDKGNISFVVRRFSAAREQYVDDRPTIPLDAQPLPQDWEQQVLTEWMAVTVVSEGQTYAPR